MANDSSNYLEMPLRLSAFSSVLPQVICGQPAGRECATQLVSNWRGARLKVWNFLIESTVYFVVPNAAYCLAAHDKALRAR